MTPERVSREVEDMTEDNVHPSASDSMRGSNEAGVGSRRIFLQGCGLTAGAAAGLLLTGSDGRLSVAQAQTAASPSGAPAQPRGPQMLDFPGKEKGLVVLGDRPLVAETPEHLLNDDTTPISKFFIRNNGQTPQPFTEGDAWRLTIDGEVNTPLNVTLGELKSRFPQKTFRMVMECGGNGRSSYQPPARGNQWTNGGAGCAEWTGVSLADVLKAAGVKPSAVYTGHYGADTHLSGDAARDVLSRGMPIAKAMDEHTLLVWGMNGEPLPAIHGGPLRLVVPGWPGSLSHKWLRRIWIRDKEHDGAGMGGTSYRIPTVPIVPGSNPDGKTNFKNMESMPTRSVITSPANGTRLAAGTRSIALRGAAWAGENTVTDVSVSADAGQSWQKMTLAPPKNRYDWNRWTGTVAVPTDGYFELWVRATDSRGLMQPHVATNWNPQGYGANALHRIAVLVG